MQLTHTIHLYFENGRYVAAVPGHPGCHAHGASYAEALGRLELMLRQRTCGLPENGSDSTDPACIDAQGDAGGRCRSSAIKARLVAKFGRLSNRQLAARIGIIAPDAPVMLSSALGGKGSRQVRCAIALALNEPPSLLWPEAAARIRTMDDRCYLDGLNVRRETSDARSAATEHAADDLHAGVPFHRRFG